jgi:hypothetical protein
MKYCVPKFNVIRSFVNVLKPAHPPALAVQVLRRKMRRTFNAHLSLGIQITLVADDDDGKVVLVLDAQYLLLEGDHFLEALP